jgi:hypothetical protein
MNEYWFRTWMTEQGVSDEESLKRVLAGRSGLNSLIKAAPEATFRTTESESSIAELTGGKGIDLTGELGCHHPDCIKNEVETLFRRTWHYFDLITLPDNALAGVLKFKDHKNVAFLAQHLTPIVHSIALIDGAGATDLVRFEPRIPSCDKHAEQHAREAAIPQAFENSSHLAKEISESAEISWAVEDIDGHKHLRFQLDHEEFMHSEGGEICLKDGPKALTDLDIKRIGSETVVRRYLAALSSDALTARRTNTPLGATIPFYRRLLNPSAPNGPGDVSFNLKLPVSKDLPIRDLIKLRQSERLAFERFQFCIRKAIDERVRSSAGADAEKIAREIERDLINPELRRIRDLLTSSKKYSKKSGTIGLILGGAATTVGLLAPQALSSLGTGLTVGGTLAGLASIKKAIDDHLSVRKDASLSNMYFLWKAKEKRH